MKIVFQKTQHGDDTGDSASIRVIEGDGNEIGYGRVDFLPAHSGAPSDQDLDFFYDIPNWLKEAYAAGMDNEGLQVDIEIVDAIGNDKDPPWYTRTYAIEPKCTLAMQSMIAECDALRAKVKEYEAALNSPKEMKGKNKGRRS
jgi:hypothetical protein